MNRRLFLQTAAAAALSRPAAAANTGFLKLGYDTYSLRAFRWKALQHLDFAAAQKLDTIQLSGLGDYESLDPAYLQKVKDAATRHGISIDAGIGCICPTTKSWNPKTGDPVEYIRTGLRVAKAVGAASMRCFIGSSADRLGPLPIDAHIEKTVEVLRAARSYAAGAGVKIAIENHSDLQARELKALIEEAGKDYVAVCLDTGNPMSVVEDPVVTMEVLGPYTVTTHVRDSVVYEHPRGAAMQWTAVGDGILDFKRILELHRRLCPAASMQLEIITGRPPRVLPYLESEFWAAFPKTNAAEFARFVALAKRGRPFAGMMIIADAGTKVPPEYQAALKQQQMVDLERSLEYCRKTLDAGIRWRT
ncbi:MAG: sugar phosphate isomerase/epimerase [Bryobacteraceae bacterium]|nr:sugar phosphate isomerase/epimerase [Bryobacterales bacterium]MEB2363682.1 sugar phosphate isomerase/epimerase [Bryobacterales bacterium]NUM99524.1 sugar phosphate isomerase/epimerase [Bryobacteraceae bacterium]